jgi:hypothetical protein
VLFKLLLLESDRITAMNGEYLGSWEEMVVVYMKVLSWNLFGKNDLLILVRLSFKVGTTQKKCSINITSTGLPIQ